jgi:hypothetical protein
MACSSLINMDNNLNPEYEKHQDVDHSMITRNLLLTYQHRIENHQAALDLVINLQAAGNNENAKSKQSSQKAT